MSNIAYVSNVRVESEDGPLRSAYLPCEETPVFFSLHGPLAKHFGFDPATLDNHAATIDYLVAAIAGCLAGTLGGALAVRHIDTTKKKLKAIARGEIELEENVFVIKRIHVNYEIFVDRSYEEVIKRVHNVHAMHCPLFRTLYKVIDITTSYSIKSEEV